MTPKETILQRMADVLEMEVTPETDLQATGKWDSLAVVVTIGAIDEANGAEVDGVALSKCQTAADVLRLAGVEP